jgi:hypothetical protein
MPIPESQLQTWSNIGATTTSSLTYSAIKRALEYHRWPSNMGFNAFLQGSYANATNIYGNSDVDIIVEDTRLYYHNLSSEEFQRLHLTPGSHTHLDFRNELISALQSYFGSSAVDTSGTKAIKVDGNGTRLRADVLPAHEYHQYEDEALQVKGIAFFTHPAGDQITNYPRQHIDNGQTKNGTYRTSGFYKPTVRMFKNMREKVIDGNESLRSRYPSYFVECLTYNLPDRFFTRSKFNTFVEGATFLSEALRNGDASKFTTASGWHWLFGPDSVQWSQDDAIRFVDSLIDYWNNY